MVRVIASLFQPCDGRVCRVDWCHIVIVSHPWTGYRKFILLVVDEILMIVILNIFKLFASKCRLLCVVCWSLYDCDTENLTLRN